MRDKPILERRFFPEGHVIIKDGDEGDFAYLIQSGSVRIYKMQGNRELALNTLEAGDIFGEMSLLFGQKRTAFAKATKDCNLILINRQKLEDKLKNSDPTIRAIVKILTRRVEQSNKMLANKDNQVGNLAEAMYEIFNKALSAMPADQKKDFRKAAAPVLEQFIDIIAEFGVEQDAEMKIVDELEDLHRDIVRENDNDKDPQPA